MERPSISVVMPTYNRREMLRRVLDALDQQQLPAGATAELIVVDDGSTDGTAELLASWRPRACTYAYRIAERNAGPGEARNIGVGLASGQLLMFTGDDILPDNLFLAAHLAAHQQHNTDGKLAVLGKTIWPRDLPVTTVMRHIDGIGAQQFSYYFFRHGQFLDYRHFYTSNITLQLDFLRSEATLFDRRFTHAAFEDVDLGLRLERRGMRIYYTSHALGYHYHPYTVHGFCERQYKAGSMATVMGSKHPDSREIIGVAAMDDAAAQAPVFALRLEAWMEGAEGRPAIERALIALAAFYELREIPPLDDYYMALFQYFYNKGIVEATRQGAESETLLGTLLVRDVAPALQRFLHLVKSGQLPGPGDVMCYLGARRLLPPPPAPRPLWRRTAGRVRRALGGRP